MRLIAAFAETCALFGNGRVFCWGDNLGGSLGDGQNIYGERNRPIPVVGVDDALEVALGNGHACVRRPDGTATCWGDASWGQLGPTAEGGPVPRPIPEFGTMVHVYAGGLMTCAVAVSGEATCFGVDAPPEFGPAASGAIASMSIGGGGDLRHSCAVLSNQTVACWGGNLHGELGDGTMISRNNPALVPNLPAISVVAVGDSHTCALALSGDVYCWGDNSSGQLGNGTTQSSAFPVQVSTLFGVRQIGAGGDHACAVLADARVACWGSDLTGEVSSVSSIKSVLLPVLVPNVRGVADLVVGAYHTCTLLGDSGDGVCWGWNDAGQLGDGTFTGGSGPVHIAWPIR